MMESSGGWDGQDPTLSVSAQDDFQQFLDMGMSNLSDSLQFDFPDYNGQQAQGQLMHQNGGEAMDTGMENGGLAGHDTTMQEHMPSMTTASGHPAIPAGVISHAPSNESLVQIDAQIQYLQQQRLHQEQREIQERQRNYYTQNRMIPPTPNSMELHGAAQFYPQSDPQQQAMYERYRMQKEQEMAFTPLVSPAVTPLDAHFNIPEYTVPGAYFSPLSSPALHAQNDHHTAYDPRSTGTTNSPIDLNPETHSAPASSVILSRGPSKKAPQKPRSTRTVRQSPIVKPRKSKRASANIPPQALGDIMEPKNPQVTRSKVASSSHSTASTEESENGSISPEHLSDMAPPPVPTPGSTGRSPYISSQKENPRSQRLVLGSPATPASLMRLTQSPQVNEVSNIQNMDIDDQGMEGFSLPEAATSRPTLSRIDTQSDGQITPTLSSTGTKTPGLQPLPSPAFSRSRTATSASQSPQIDSMNGANGRKPSQSASRNSKKRSGSSVLASPALLPRISPSIKPLMPGSGSVSENTASLLLASKSNYQNILEGTHLPGVSYPSELSTNLTSKRTSHKIAEQGRRNRINSALQEIATLLPRGAKDSCGEKSGSGDAGEPNETGGKGGAQSANSKASTVEQAIEYIKQLKADLADANKRAEEAEKLLDVKS
ncbi:Phosphorus acquisition-controlling protein [Lachnellula suecica]|uniref:Phosphorus acquisition-controlling protein n=1 Tax=Lachnellula suecica TaxID=602035 RepID=A0A8T9C6D0_9HELO|nr:Phosphorus acquisition-controlling protein [Lachnellula suecica]